MEIGSEQAADKGTRDMRARTLALPPATRRASPQPLTVLVVAILLILRRPESFFSPQLWAEDSNLYYAEALIAGAAHTLFVPYSGYFQVVPRLVGAVSAHLPAIAVPAFFSLISYIIAIWACSLFAGPQFRNVIASPGLRFLVCCAIAVVPPATELTGAITNSHWYLSLGALLVLIGEPRGGRNRAIVNAGCATAMLLTSLSGAETILLAPLALWRTCVVRDPYARAIPVAFLIGIVAQCVSLKLAAGGDAPIAHATIDTTILSTSDAFIHRVVLTAIAGEPASKFLSAHDLEGIVFLLALLVTIAFVSILQRLPNARVPLILLMALCLASLAAALDGRGVSTFYPGLRVTGYGGQRYFILPLAYFLLGAAIVIENIERIGTRAKCVCFAALFALGFIFNLRDDDLPDKHWATYAPAIDRWVAAQRQGRPAPPVAVPMNPGNWLMILPVLN